MMTPPNKWCWRIFVLLVRILLMSIPKDFGDDDRNIGSAEVRRPNRHPKTTVVASATPAVSQNLRLRYNNVDVAASANGVSGDYFNVMA